MEREKISLTVKELKDLVFDNSEEFVTVTHETTGIWRHGTEETSIVKRLSDGKFFQIHWRDSVKDECEFYDMNDSGEHTEVFPYEEVVIKYK